MKASWSLPVLALVSSFFFSWQITLFLAVAGAYVFPPTGILAGLLVDLLYAPRAPYTATLIGLFITAAAYGVRILVKRNIIE